jgi:hypothetical protein
MPATRRAVLKSAALAGAVAMLPGAATADAPPPKKLRILILGGTHEGRPGFGAPEARDALKARLAVWCPGGVPPRLHTTDRHVTTRRRPAA